ncbi:phosphoribosyl-AMP cyclohydrolase [Candidatus Latescibacterota bacterium]
MDDIRFDAAGLVAVAVTDYDTRRLLVLCYMDREALERTLSDGRVHLYRRSQSRVALKGETSGHVQTVEEVRVNCDTNSLEMRVRQEVGACHAGYFSCYYRRWDPADDAWVVDEDRVFDPERVYT